MFKRLGVFATSCAVICGMTASVALASTASSNFGINATVSSLATLSFGLSGSNYTFGTITDNTTASVAAANNSSGTIHASVRSTTSGGTASIYVTAPSSIAGASGGSIPIGELSYTCTGSYTVDTAGGGTTTSSSGVHSTQTAFTGGSGNTCVSFTLGQSISASSLNLNLFLDDRYIPADTYSGGNFSITVSAT